MQELPDYPENRLDIRVDAQGNIHYQQNPEFAKYYAPTRAEKEEELEDLQYRLELLELDEPDDLYGDEHDDWEDEKRRLEDEIEDLEEDIDGMEE